MRVNKRKSLFNFKSRWFHSFCVTNKDKLLCDDFQQRSYILFHFSLATKVSHEKFFKC